MAPVRSYPLTVRLLCLSDIHGHADALAAVLATAERRGYDQILVAGDLCFPGPKPLETWRRLAHMKAICVQGAADRALATLDFDGIHATSDHERARLTRASEVKGELGELILLQLARLPRAHRVPLPNGGELMLVHGSPVDPLEPITHEMTDEEISGLLGDDPADIVVCGGSHVPFDRIVTGVRIINVGSVGEGCYGEHRDVSIGAAYADATFLEVNEVGPREVETATLSGDPSIGPGAVHAHPVPHSVRVEQFVVPLGRAA